MQLSDKLENKIESLKKEMAVVRAQNMTNIVPIIEFAIVALSFVKDNLIKKDELKGKWGSWKTYLKLGWMIAKFVVKKLV